MRLVAVDAAAAKLGLAPGQNFADARAQIPELELREFDMFHAVQVFAEFADWHSNASPIVSVLGDVAPFGDLILDITGVTHLFGGEENMLAMLVGRLSKLGFTIAGAIADTIGAAFALAHFAPGSIVVEGGTAAVLADLPIVALRLEAAQVHGLGMMGLKTIGQLYDRDRKALQARFGRSLLARLDQALGMLVERVTPRLPKVDYYAEHRFADPIGFMDDVLMCTRDLAIRLTLQLEAEGLGAQSFHLLLYRVDHKVMCLSVNAARATRDPNHITHLFVHRSERLEGEYDAGFGIDMIRLAASSTSQLESTQFGAFQAEDGSEDLDQLYDRMTSRLGTLVVMRPKFLNSHVPEQAVALEPIIARTTDDSSALAPVRALRPLRLLPAPEAIEVSMTEVPDGPPAGIIWRNVAYSLVKASGADRIREEWRDTTKSMSSTRSDDTPSDAYDTNAVTRDYFVVEDDKGTRFWLFRQGYYGHEGAPRWFLHGIFA